MNGTLYDFVNGFAERRVIGPLRRELLADLRGQLVDVGAGTGANCRYYGPNAHVLVLEPDPSMARRVGAKLQSALARIDFQIADDRFLDTLEARSIDAVIFALVLCTIDNPTVALQRAARVLKTHGALILIEHVRSTGRLGLLQDLIAPLWRCLTSGCHVNRDTESALVATGFDTRVLRTKKLSGLSPIRKLIYGRLPLLSPA